MGVWIVAIVYAVKAYKLRNDTPILGRKYLVGLGMILVSYLVIWVGFFRGYIVTV